MALFYVRRDAEGIITESILVLKMCQSKNFETSMSISLVNGQNIVVPIMELKDKLEVVSDKDIPRMVEGK